mmetsp:Transcript_15617/g.41949  ORF Transcript_15617/g.41949 Transcript_15617/m.41949 type:complete len:204 (+) Transcript_15617:1424-2035(+)
MWPSGGSAGAACAPALVTDEAAAARSWPWAASEAAHVPHWLTLMQGMKLTPPAMTRRSSRTRRARKSVKMTIMAKVKLEAAKAQNMDTAGRSVVTPTEKAAMAVREVMRMAGPDLPKERPTRSSRASRGSSALRLSTMMMTPSTCTPSRMRGSRGTMGGKRTPARDATPKPAPHARRTLMTANEPRSTRPLERLRGFPSVSAR